MHRKPHTEGFAVRSRAVGFTIIELLVVISIIALLISILLPALGSARDRARFIKWAGYSHSMRTDTRALIYYNFQEQDGSETNSNNELEIHNRAALDPMLTSREDIEPQDFDSKVIPEGTSGVVQAPEWEFQDSRWKGKGGFEFFGNAALGRFQTDNFENPRAAISVVVSARSRTSTWNATGMLVSKRDAFIHHPAAGGTTSVFYVNDGGWRNTGYYNHGDSSNWHFFVGTWNQKGVDAGSERKLVQYIDGNRQVSGTSNGPINGDPNGPMFVGWDDSQANRFLDGFVDEVAIFNAALSQDQAEEWTRVGAKRRRD